MTHSATSKTLAEVSAREDHARSRSAVGGALNPDTHRERLFDDLMENIAQGVCVVDHAFTVRLVNRRFMEMFDLPAAYAAPGRHFGDYIRRSLMRWTSDEDEIEAHVQGVLADFNGMPDQRLTEAWPDGRYIELWRRPFRDGAFVTTYTDITVLKSTELALRAAKQAADAANHAKSEFLATMSHELRTPLNAIIGFGEMMEEEVLGPLGSHRYKEYAADIRASGQHLLALINDILDLCKVEAGKANLEVEPVDLVSIVDSETRRQAPDAERAGVRLRTEIAKAVPPALAEPRRVRQILANLLTNANKFTPFGGTVSVAASAGPNGFSVLSVSDTGRGMTTEELARVGEPFWRGVDAQRIRGRPGTGLGLSIVKRLVELHDGTIEIESAPNTGTRVVVRLPVAPSPGLEDTAPNLL